MEISQDTQEVIKFLDEVTGGNLRKKNDLAAILEIGASRGNYELIDDIIFTGRTLWNLHGTISKSNTGTEGIDKLHEEYRTTSIELVMKLNELTEGFDETISKRFGDIYYAKTAGAFRNLIDLAHDLAKLKEVQTTMKSERAKRK